MLEAEDMHTDWILESSHGAHTGMCAHTEHTPTPSRSCANKDESPSCLHQATWGALTLH